MGKSRTGVYEHQVSVVENVQASQRFGPCLCESAPSPESRAHLAPFPPPKPSCNMQQHGRHRKWPKTRQNNEFLSPQELQRNACLLCKVSLRDVCLVCRPPDRSSLGRRFVSDCGLRGFSYSEPSQQLCFWHELALVYTDGGERSSNPAPLFCWHLQSCEQLRTPRPLLQIFFFVRWAVHNYFKASQFMCCFSETLADIFDPSRWLWSARGPAQSFRLSEWCG